jgi:hypothetical protein
LLSMVLVFLCPKFCLQSLKRSLQWLYGCSEGLGLAFDGFQVGFVMSEMRNSDSQYT